jgi:hypothetical protein
MTEAQSNHDRKSLAILYVWLPIAANNPKYIPGFQQQEVLERINEATRVYWDNPLGQCPGHFLKLGEGVFLVEENACYPALLKVFQNCAEHHFPVMMMPLSDSSLTLSIDRPEWKAFLEEKGQSFRMTGFEPKEAQNRT